jgi:hypothetical protein
METLAMLGAALGLGTLSGISLYLAVFVTGISLDLGWIALRPDLAPLEALAHPVVWGVAFLFYLMEFFADKVPWVDSVWDAIHTVVRPVGAMFVGMAALGEVQPTLEVLAGLLAGTAALTTHAAKASLRLVVNSSPEPFSNIAVSSVEDVIVATGAWFTLTHPVEALVVSAVFVGGLMAMAPFLFRSARAQMSFIAGKLGQSLPAGAPLEKNLPHEADIALAPVMGSGEKVAWVIPCLTGKLPGLPRHVRGWLVGTECGTRLYFAGHHLWRTITHSLALSDTKAELRERLLFDELILYRTGDGVVGRFRFRKKHAGWARQIADKIKQPGVG